MTFQKWLTIVIIAAAIVFVAATVVSAAQTPGDIFDKANKAVGTIQAVCGLIVATGLYLKLPKGVQTVVDAALKIPPDFKDQLIAKLGTPEARGSTVEREAIKLAAHQGWHITPEQIKALRVVLEPYAKRIKLKIP